VPENSNCKMINIHLDLNDSAFGTGGWPESMKKDVSDDFLSNILFNRDEYMKIAGHNDIEDLMRKIVFEMDNKKDHPYGRAGCSLGEPPGVY